jgi:hypothetical protein
MITPTKIKQAENGLGNAKGTPSESENKMDDIKRKLERVPQMRVKDEARPALRDALNKFEEQGLSSKETISESRRMVRDGDKNTLEELAQIMLQTIAEKCPNPSGDAKDGQDDENGAQDENQNANGDDQQQSEREKELEKELEDAKNAKKDSEERARELAQSILEGQNAKAKNLPLGKAIEHWGLKFIEPMVRVNKQVLLVGPAGTGKTFMGRQLNAKLGHDEDRFYGISLSAGVSEAHLSGRMVFDGSFLDTKFLDIVENGGTILLDEFDNADPNVLVGLNQLLANDEISVPLRRGNESATRHEECYIVCSANTWGNAYGAQGFVRNQIDSATLDRFACSKFHLLEDRRISNAMIGLDDDFSNYPNPKKFGTDRNAKEVKTLLREVRDVINDAINSPEKNIGREELSPRIYSGARGLIENYYWSAEQVLEILLQDWTDEQLRAIDVRRSYRRRRYGLITTSVSRLVKNAIEGDA